MSVGFMKAATAAEALGKTLDDLAKGKAPELGKASKEFDSFVKKFTDFGNKTNKASAPLKETGKAAGEASNEVKKLSGSLDKMMDVAAIAGVVRGVSAIKNELRAVVDASREAELALAGVFKTVDATALQKAGITQDIRAMSLEIPLTATEIAGKAFKNAIG